MILVPYHKPPDPMMDLYDGQTFDLETSVDIWMRVDVALVEYRTLAQILYLIIWYFRHVI